MRSACSRWGRSPTAQAEEIVVRRRAVLDAALEEARSGELLSGAHGDGRPVVALRRRRRRVDPRSVDRGAARRAHRAVSPAPSRSRSGFRPTPRSRRLYDAASASGCRRGSPSTGAAGEMLAYASLVSARRHRSASRGRTRGAAPSAIATRWSSTSKTGAPYVPLAQLAQGGGRFEVWDSPLSEAGRARLRLRTTASTTPTALVIWEGAVRRLRQQRAGHHRPVRHLGRRQVAPL